MAIVTKADMIPMLPELHLSYFHQLHRIYVTEEEQAARTWSAEIRIAGRDRTHGKLNT